MKKGILTAVLLSLALAAPVAIGAQKKPAGKAPSGQFDGSEQRVYFENTIAEVTALYDPIKRQTGFLKTYLAVTGPAVNKETVRVVLRNCAKSAGLAAAGMFKSTAGEGTARTAAAYATFKAAMYRCLSLKGLAKEFANKMAPNISFRMNWKDGFDVKVEVDFRNRAVFEKAMEVLRANGIPEDTLNGINRIYRITEIGQEIKINVRLDTKLPNLPGLRAPDPKKVDKMLRDTAERLARQGFPIWAGVAGPLRVTAATRQEVERIVGGITAQAQECLRVPAKCAIRPVEDCLRGNAKACVNPPWAPATPGGGAVSPACLINPVSCATGGIQVPGLPRLPW